MWDKRRYYDRSNSNLLRVCRKTAVSTKICPSKLLASFLNSNRYSNMSLGVTVPVTPQPWGILLRSFLNGYSHCYCHSYHRIISCADETHHLCASAQFPIFQHIIALYPSLGTHTLFRLLHCINLFNEHIVFSFDRCIISCFDAFANRLLISSQNAYNWYSALIFHFIFR